MDVLLSWVSWFEHGFTIGIVRNNIKRRWHYCLYTDYLCSISGKRIGGSALYHTTFWTVVYFKQLERSKNACVNIDNMHISRRATSGYFNHFLMESQSKSWWVSQDKGTPINSNAHHKIRCIIGCLKFMRFIWPIWKFRNVYLSMFLRTAAGFLACLSVWVLLTAESSDELPRGIWGIAILFGAYAIRGNAFFKRT